MNPTWLGLRDEDLTDEERAARQARLCDDPAARRAHDEALVLARRLASLPDLPPDGVVAAKRPWALTLGSAFLVMAALWMVAPREEPAPVLRARGGGSADADVVLRAVAEGGGTARKLRDGDVVGAHEQVVFEVETGATGELVVEEAGVRTTRVWPVDTTWEVEAGRHFVGGGHALAWRADEPGLHRYAATFCPSSGGACTTTALSLRWSAP